MAGVASSSLKNAKALLRKEMIQKLAALTTEEKKIQSDILLEKLKNLPAYNNSRRIALYLNMKDEVNTTGIIEDILLRKKACFVPLCNKNEMEMVRLYSLKDLQHIRELPTRHVFNQPLESEIRENALDFDELELIIVPGLAFTLDGKRLGRGKGYYDKYLKRCKKWCNHGMTTVALVFREQIVADVPTDENDFLIDMVITPDTK